MREYTGSTEPKNPSWFPSVQSVSSSAVISGIWLNVV